MSVADVRLQRLLAAMFPESDTITRGQWRARTDAGPAPLPAATPKPVCPTCGNHYKQNAPHHGHCSRTCRLRWHAQQRLGAAT